MRSKILVIGLLISSNVFGFNDDPNRPFDASSNFTTTSVINWRTVDDVQKACEAESRKRGFKGFGYAVQACSFYDGNQCTVITGKQTTMHSLGHEVRHCFQGNWH